MDKGEAWRLSARHPLLGYFHHAPPCSNRATEGILTSPSDLLRRRFALNSPYSPSHSPYKRTTSGCALSARAAGSEEKDALPPLPRSSPLPHSQLGLHLGAERSPRLTSSQSFVSLGALSAAAMGGGGRRAARRAARPRAWTWAVGAAAAAAGAGRLPAPPPPPSAPPSPPGMPPSLPRLSATRPPPSLPPWWRAAATRASAPPSPLAAGTF